MILYCVYVACAENKPFMGVKRGWNAPVYERLHLVALWAAWRNMETEMDSHSHQKFPWTSGKSGELCWETSYVIVETDSRLVILCLMASDCTEEVFDWIAGHLYLPSGRELDDMFNGHFNTMYIKSHSPISVVQIFKAVKTSKPAVPTEARFFN